MARMWKKGNLSALLVGMYMDLAAMENSMEVAQILKKTTTIR